MASSSASAATESSMKEIIYSAENFIEYKETLENVIVDAVGVNAVGVNAGANGSSVSICGGVGNMCVGRDSAQSGCVDCARVCCVVNVVGDGVGVCGIVVVGAPPKYTHSRTHTHTKS